MDRDRSSTPKKMSCLRNNISTTTFSENTFSMENGGTFFVRLSWAVNLVVFESELSLKENPNGESDNVVRLLKRFSIYTLIALQDLMAETSVPVGQLYAIC